MKILCYGDTIKSRNDKDTHYISSTETELSFYDSIKKLNINYRRDVIRVIYKEQTLGINDSEIILKPRSDGSYSMLDEIFNQYVSKEKWSSVAITDKNGKPFYIKDRDLIYQIIMRCEESYSGSSGNNALLKNMIKEECEYPNKKDNEDWDSYRKRVEKWKTWWGLKPHTLNDCGIFQVSLFSSSYACSKSFISPKGKVGFLNRCCFEYEPIKYCREELEWICNEICSEENGLEFYVSFFNEDLGDKYSRNLKDPFVTFKLSYKGIELSPFISVEKMKKIFKCNQNIYGKEWKRVNFLWGVKKFFRSIQKKLNHDKWVTWHNYDLLGDKLNSIINLSERYYTVDEIIRMIQIWKENYCK